MIFLAFSSLHMATWLDGRSKVCCCSMLVWQYVWTHQMHTRIKAGKTSLMLLFATSTNSAATWFSYSGVPTLRRKVPSLIGRNTKFFSVLIHHHCQLHEAFLAAATFQRPMNTLQSITSNQSTGAVCLDLCWVVLAMGNREWRFPFLWYKHVNIISFILCSPAQETVPFASSSLFTSGIAHRLQIHHENVLSAVCEVPKISTRAMFPRVLTALLHSNVFKNVPLHKNGVLLVFCFENSCPFLHAWSAILYHRRYLDYFT